MKKTTKILLVLAAVVAMTIGAVSTVMAADVVIGTWIEPTTTDGKWQALDTNGEEIIRGWAKSEAQRWYYFDSGYMVTNTFVTDQGKVYYLDGNGSLPSNAWIAFDDETAITFDKRYYQDITQAFDIIYGNYTFDDVFVEDATYEKMWCFFNESGELVTDAWVKAYDMHYYICGPFCVMGDFSVEVDLNHDGDLADANEGNYGFGPDGHMFSGWTEVIKTTGATQGSTTNAGTPYENTTAGSAGSVAKDWIYYAPNGKKVDTGWELVEGEWYYFVPNTTIVDDNGMMPDVIMLKDVILELNVSGTAYTHYIDGNGRMYKGTKTFSAGSNAATVKVVDAAGAQVETITIPANTSKVINFSTTNGALSTGKAGNYYYYNSANTLFGAAADKMVVSGSAVEFATTISNYIDGERVKDSFFITLVEGNNTNTYYYEAGRLIKNTTVSFAGVSIAIDSNGVIKNISGNQTVTVGGITYKVDPAASTVTVGDLVFNGVVRR